MKPDFTRLYDRWKTGTLRTEEMKVPLPKPATRVDFILTDEHGLCSNEQKELLLDCASLEFKLETFSSIATILNKLKVEVHICKGKAKKDVSYLKKVEDHWQKKLKSQKDCEKANKALPTIKGEEEFWGTHNIRGCYKPIIKVIELYPEVMMNEYDGKCMAELLITTLAHETMHAFFDRPKHNDYPYAYFVEEPMAEFGMLLYLRETGMPAWCQEWAHYDVAGKRSCYRYGASLFDQYLGGEISLRDYLEGYKYDIDLYDMPDTDSSGTILRLPIPVSLGIASRVATHRKRLKVEIPGKEIIYKSQSCDTFVAALDKVIEEKGFENFLNAVDKAKEGKPLISNDSFIYSSYRTSKRLKYTPDFRLISDVEPGHESEHEFGDIFFVDTDSSNKRKANLLNKIFLKLCLNWKATVE